MNRRAVLLSGIGAAGLFALPVLAQSVIQPEALAAGRYIWQPDISRHGAVAIVVSLPEQLVHVYRGGIRIGVSTCSTGTAGHRTPTGVFTILQKDKDHYSNVYDNAPMPNMDRLTWDGIALHAGHLPGYPASHGCIRLPRAFSNELFKITQVGTPVIIAGESRDPWNLQNPGLTLTHGQLDRFTQAVDELKRRPSDWNDAKAHPALTLIASSADRRIEFLVNGRLAAESELFITGPTRLGEHVLILDQAASGQLGWNVIVEDKNADVWTTAIGAGMRMRGNDTFTRTLIAAQQVGMTLVITDYPLSPDTRSAPGFTILTS